MHAAMEKHWNWSGSLPRLHIKCRKTETSAVISADNRRMNHACNTDNLKILGIILLVLLGLLLVIVFSVLFVPVRYRLEGEKSSPGWSEANGKVRVSWLLHLIHLRIQYQEKELDWECYLFGVPLKKAGAAVREWKKKRRKKKIQEQKERRKKAVQQKNKTGKKNSCEEKKGRKNRYR